MRAPDGVTATVKDAGGQPNPGVIVRFSVSGSVSTTGSATTNTNGDAQFCYMGPALPGSDTITAYADVDNDTMQDTFEPSGPPHLALARFIIAKK